MELINKYRTQCYNGNFKCENVWINFTSQYSELSSYLKQSQAGDRSTSTISISDIDHIMSELSQYDYDDELTTKLVIQKANFNVKPQSIANGCTTRLFFFLKDGSEWYLYGHAKARYTDWGLFNIKKGEKLGYTIFLSLQEQYKEISSGVPDNQLLMRLIERFKKAAIKQS